MRKVSGVSEPTRIGSHCAPFVGRGVAGRGVAVGPEYKVRQEKVQIPRHRDVVTKSNEQPPFNHSVCLTSFYVKMNSLLLKFYGKKSLYRMTYTSR